MTDQTDQTDLTLLQHAEPLAVVRLGPGADIPAWATSATLFSVTATADETSLVCGRHGVPRKASRRGRTSRSRSRAPSTSR